MPTVQIGEEEREVDAGTEVSDLASLLGVDHKQVRVIDSEGNTLSTDDELEEGMEVEIQPVLRGA